MRSKILTLGTCIVLISLIQVKAQIITTIAGNGTGAGTSLCSVCYGGDSAAATSAELNKPSSVFVDASGNVFISDYANHRIRKVSASTGIITTIAGSGTPPYNNGYAGDGGAATSAKLNGPGGIFVDASGNVFIADGANYRIRKVDGSTGVISTIAGNGTQGYSGDGGMATNAKLNNPGGVFVDAAGNVFIADLGNSRIRKVNSSTGIITTIAGTGTGGYSGDGGMATNAELDSPSGVCVDASGNVFIVDYINSNIRKVDGSTGIISTIAGNGTQGYAGDGGAATNAELFLPSGIFVDSFGNLFIADLANNRIRKVNGSTGIISTIAGNGTAGFAGDGAAAINAELHNPGGVFVDAAGNVFIAEEYNNRVRVVCNTTCVWAGVEKITKADEVNVYPNPNSGNFTVVTNENATAIMVTDLLGNELLNVIPVNTATHINLGSLPSGLYFIKVTANGEQIFKHITITN